MGSIDIARFYRPNRAQAAAHRDGHKVILALGGWRSSKSTWARWEMVMWALEAAAVRGTAPPATFCVFRKTEPALEDTIQKDWMDLPDGLIVDRRISRGRSYVRLRGGSKVIFRGLDDRKKIGSLELDGAHLEEAEEFERADFDYVLGRLSGKRGPRRLLVTCNPPTKTHWLHKAFVEEQNPDRSVHHFSTYDNAENLAPDYIATLEKLDEPTRRRYVFGEWGFVPKGTPMYKGFRESTHASRPLRAVYGVDNVLLRGWDFGFHHPFCVWAQVFPTISHVNILKELRGADVDIRVFAAAVLAQTRMHFPYFRPRETQDYVDPAGDQKNDVGTSSVMELRKFNLSPMFRRMRLAPSIRAVQYLIQTWHLDRPMLMVDPSCRTVIDGFVGGYAMGPNGEPIKDGEYDHAMDATRVALAPMILDLHIDPHDDGQYAGATTQRVSV